VSQCSCLTCKHERDIEFLSKRRREYLESRLRAVHFLPTRGGNSLPKFSELCPSAKSFVGDDVIPSQWISKEQHGFGGRVFDKLIAKRIPNEEYARKQALSKPIPNLTYNVHYEGLLESLEGHVGLKKYRVYSLFAKQKGDEHLDLSDVMASFSTVLDNIVKKFIKEEKLKGDDRIQIVMTTEKGVMLSPISSKIQKVKDFDISNFLIHAAAYFQSDKTIKISDRIIVELIRIRVDSDSDSIGVGGARFKIVNLKKGVLKKHSCVPVVNDDNMCLARAIVLCLAKKGLLKDIVLNLKPGKKLESPRIFKFDNIKRSVNTFQKDIASFLCSKCGIQENVGGGVNEIRLFESLLKIRIKVFDGCNFMKVIYSAPFSASSSSEKPIIHLLRSEGEREGGFHFDSIVNIRGFLGKFFCDFCDISHKNKFAHRCSDVSEWCYTCNHRDCFERKIFNQECFLQKRSFRKRFCLWTFQMF
jgi:hypothetical protein